MVSECACDCDVCDKETPLRKQLESRENTRGKEEDRKRNERE